MTKPCEKCLNLAMYLKAGLCQPCRVRAGETIPGHQLVVATEESETEPLGPSSSGDGSDVVQIPLG